MIRTALALLLALGLSGCDGAGKSGFDSTLDGQALDLAPFDGTTTTDGVADTDTVDVNFQDHQNPDEIYVDILEDLAEEIVEDALVEDALTDSSPDIDIPPGCCLSDSDCPGGQNCVGGLEGDMGVCKEIPTGDECWWFADCATGQMCKDASVCPCGELCFMMDQTGECVDVIPSGCCFADSDCVNEEICIGVGPDESPGICVFTPQAGQCWEDDHCLDGQICQGANWCPCGEVCNMMEYHGPGQCIASESCATGPVNVDGVGTPCNSNLDACNGLAADMCSTSIFANPNLPALCTRYCNGVDPCGPNTFCFPAGWSSCCVPDSCAEPFLTSCISNLDCVIATKWDICCPCPEVKTRAQVEMDPCLFEGASIPTDLPEQCQIICPFVLCDECPGDTKAHCGNYQCLAGPGGN